jgi:hypothetical protein
VSEVVQTWNATAKALGLPQVLRVEGRRRDAIRARLREAGWLELFRQALEALATSPELAWARGAKPMGDGGVFRADLDFMLRPGKAVWMVERAGVPAGPGRAGLRSALHDAAESMKAQLRAQKQQSPNPNGDAHDLMPDLRSGADGSEFDLPPLPSRP